MEQLLWFKYKVKEPLNWVGHLAIMRVFERAWRRSGLPVAHSQGFNPRIKQSFGLPLVVGATSDCEYGDIRFNQWVNVREVQDKVAVCLHPGIEVTKMVLAPTLNTSLMQTVRYADYHLKVAEGNGLAAKVEQFLAQPQVLMIKKTKHNNKEIDIKPLVRRLEMLAPDTISMRLQSGEKGTLKPLELLKTLDPTLEPVRLHRLLALDSQENELF